MTASSLQKIFLKSLISMADLTNKAWATFWWISYESLILAVAYNHYAPF